MDDFAFGRSARARVWIDDPRAIPPYAGECELRREFPAEGAFVPRVSAVTVEVAANVGPFVRYGLVGLSINPHRQQQVLVRVPYSRRLGGVFVTPLAGPPEDVRLGLSAEFAPAALNAILPAVGLFAPCEIGIMRACVGAIGTSDDWVSRLCGAAMGIVLSRGATPAEVREIIRRTFGEG